MSCREVAERFIREQPFRCELAGSLRRGEESTHDVDIVCLDPSMPLYTHTRDTVQADNCTLDVHSSNPEHEGPMMLAWTGPSGANIGMRSQAKRKGMLLNEYGLFQDHVRIDDNTEDDICQKVLNRQCKPLAGSG